MLKIFTDGYILDLTSRADERSQKGKEGGKKNEKKEKIGHNRKKGEGKCE